MHHSDTSLPPPVPFLFAKLLCSRPSPNIQAAEVRFALQRAQLIDTQQPPEAPGGDHGAGHLEVFHEWMWR